MSEMNRTERMNMDRKIVGGAKKLFHGAKTITLVGEAYSVDELTQVFQDNIDANQAAEDAH